MQQVAASIASDQDIGSHGSGDGWLTALAVHRGSFLPLHRQIHDLVRQEIDAGRLAPGSRLPSEGALAEQWGVSLAPVRQALMHLAGRYYAGRVGIGSTDAGSASPDTTKEVNLFGTPEEVVDRIQMLREDFSSDEIMFEVNWTSSVPRDVVMQTMRILTDKVIPKFK